MRGFRSKISDKNFHFIHNMNAYKDIGWFLSPNHHFLDFYTKKKLHEAQRRKIALLDTNPGKKDRRFCNVA